MGAAGAAARATVDGSDDAVMASATPPPRVRSRSARLIVSGGPLPTSAADAGCPATLHLGTCVSLSSSKEQLELMAPLFSCPWLMA